MPKILDKNGFLEYTIDKNEIILDNIKVYVQRKGTGKNLINKLKDIARDNRLPIILYSYPQDDTITDKELNNFYISQGFDLHYNDVDNRLFIIGKLNKNMTALQTIIKEAKSLKTKYPKRYSKWTDYVKQASAIYSSKHKGKSQVGKKKVVKKSIAKKPTKKIILKKVHSAKSTSKKKPLIIKKEVKKVVSHKNTLTKVKEALKSDHKRLTHGYTMTKGNVRIGNIYEKNRQNFIDLLEQIQFIEQEKYSVIKDKKNYIAEHGKKYYDWYLRHTNKWIKELKTHKNEIFKLL